MSFQIVCVFFVIGCYTVLYLIDINHADDRH